MVLKVYVSGISASKEVKKRQQRALLIMDSAQVDYEQVDITEPGREEEREQVQPKWKVRSERANPLPPQFFKDEEYLGDYDDFNTAVDVNDLASFLRMEILKEEKANEIVAKELKTEVQHNESIITNEENEEKITTNDDHKDLNVVHDHVNGVVIDSSTEIEIEEEVIESNENKRELEGETEVPTEEKQVVKEAEEQGRTSHSSSDNKEEEGEEEEEAEDEE